MPRSPKPKKRPLTLREKKFAKAYIENNGNAALAARTAYNVKQGASRQLGTQVLHKPVVAERITTLLAKSGITLDFLNDKGFTALQNNLDNGRPSQAVGASLLQFYYKLYDALPASKSMSIKTSIREITPGSNVDEIVKRLEKLDKTTKILLARRK